MAAAFLDTGFFSCVCPELVGFLTLDSSTVCFGHYLPYPTQQREQGRLVAPCVQMCLRGHRSHLDFCFPQNSTFSSFQEWAHFNKPIMVTSSALVSSAARLSLSLSQHTFHFQKPHSADQTGGNNPNTNCPHSSSGSSKPTKVKATLSWQCLEA